MLVRRSRLDSGPIPHDFQGSKVSPFSGGSKRGVGGGQEEEKKELLLPSSAAHLAESDGLLLDVGGCQRRNVTGSFQVLDGVVGMELKMEATLDLFTPLSTRLTVSGGGEMEICAGEV